MEITAKNGFKIKYPDDYHKIIMDWKKNIKDRRVCALTVNEKTLEALKNHLEETTTTKLGNAMSRLEGIPIYVADQKEDIRVFYSKENLKEYMEKHGM